jgi:mercuric reductase
MHSVNCFEPSVNGHRDRSPDLAVIGAGSAGFAAAIRAAELGASVVLIGGGTLGGTCVNVGCIPSKALIRAVEPLHQAQAASRFAGISASARVDDWRKLVGQKDDLVADLRQAKYADVLDQYEGITYRQGAARLTKDGIEVDGEILTPRKIVIATGARPAVPAIAGLDGVPWLTSTTALELTELPASLLVIGGGFIGCEMGQMFARAGVRVTIVARSGLLSGAEPEVSEALTRYFGDEGIDVRSGVRCMRIGAASGATGVALEIQDEDGVPEIINAERVLVATGRCPNTAGLGLEDVGVGLGANKGILIDDRMRTTRVGVYAAGDVTGRNMYVYMAAYGAKIAAENALNGDLRGYDDTAMPDVTFTDPQVATVGLTAARAEALGFDVQSVILPLEVVPRALAARDTRGLIKLVADSATRRLLGAHILAPEGADSIQTAVLAIKHGLTVDDLADTIFPYLTTVEGLKLAALGFSKDVARLSCCAG